MKNKKPYTFFIEVEVLTTLNNLANKRETTVSNLIRKSINQFLTKSKTKTK
jgi:hypothetical protein